MPRQAERGLHFINTNPSSVKSRSDLIHEIRSHAGRWRWQQARQDEDEYRDGYLDSRGGPHRLDDSEYIHGSITEHATGGDETLRPVALRSLAPDVVSVETLGTRRLLSSGVSQFNDAQVEALLDQSEVCLLYTSDAADEMD